MAGRAGARYDVSALWLLNVNQQNRVCAAAAHAVLLLNVYYGNLREMVQRLI